MSEDAQRDALRTVTGLAYAALACVSWGVVPVFWKSLSHVPAFEVVAHRVIWTPCAFLVLMGLRGRSRDLAAALGNRRVWRTLVVSGALISLNGLLVIHATATGRVLHVSLGYFITPLVSILLGMLLLGERLRPVQWVAIVLASVGVFLFTSEIAGWPWISLLLAVTFGFYSYLRKTAAVESLPGSALETLLMMPIGLIYVATLGGQGQMGQADALTHVLLVATGIVTAIPLLWFTNGARRLPLTTVGFLQYLAPTGQFLLAVLAYGEAFTAAHARGFGFIWTGLLFFTLESWHHMRAVDRAGAT